MDTVAIRNEMITAARAAAEARYRELGGDGMACGFAWTTVYPTHKGNTRQGREERKILAALGLRKDWTGKAYEVWNPSGSPVQNIDIKGVRSVMSQAFVRPSSLHSKPRTGSVS